MQGILDHPEVFELKKFTFLWLDGTNEVSYGRTQSGAWRRAGYGAGSINALYCILLGDNEEYIWNDTTKKWNRKEKEDVRTDRHDQNVT